MPTDVSSGYSAFVRAVVNTGRVFFAACFGQRLTPFYCADFTKHPEHPDVLEAIASVLRFADHPNLVFRDDELAYWHLIWTLKDENLKSSGALPLRDAMRAKWAHVCELQIRQLVDDLAALRVTPQVQDPYLSPSAREGLPAAMPFFDEIARTLMSPSSTVGEIVALASGGMSDPKKTGDLVHGMIAAFKHDVLVEPLKWLMKDSLLAGLLSPATTRCGLSRPWLDGRAESGDVTVRHIDLDMRLLGLLR